MQKENRKLSTILAMDVVNYSSKMSEDDVGTLKLLAEMKNLIENLQNRMEVEFLIQLVMCL